MNLPAKLNLRMWGASTRLHVQETLKARTELLQATTGDEENYQGVHYPVVMLKQPTTCPSHMAQNTMSNAGD